MTLSGALASFYLSRTHFHTYRTKLITHYPKFTTIERAVFNGGLKFLILIRVAPYPFGLSNVLFSATSVTFREFFVASGVALLKNLVPVWIGSGVAELADVKEKTSVAQVVSMLAGMAVGVGSFFYMMFKVRRILRDTEVSMGETGEEEVLVI